MKNRKIMLSLMIAIMALLVFHPKAQDTTMAKANHNNMSMNNNMMPDLSSWPEASQMAAKEMMDKYGKPDLANNDLLV
jgi:hypothetical protein